LISDRIGFVYYFYVLKSKKTSRFYYGLTSDLKRRLEEHNEGKSRSTKRGRPWKLVYYEAYLSVDDARRRELSVKNYGNVLTYIKRRISESIKVAPANYVPAAAVIRRVQALSGIIGRKEFCRRPLKFCSKSRGSTSELDKILGG